MRSRQGVVVAAFVFALAAGDARAMTVRRMNLSEMCTRADKAFRGVVVHAQPGEVEVAGGRLPVVTYRLRVEEGFKGQFKEARGQRFVEVKLLGDVKVPRRGQRVRLLLPGLPRLQVGETYLLLTTRPGATGLETTVGLGQGLFRVHRAPQGEVAQNAVDNRDLLRGMAREPAASGPMAYDRLAERIRGLVAEGGKR